MSLLRGTKRKILLLPTLLFAVSVVPGEASRSTADSSRGNGLVPAVESSPPPVLQEPVGTWFDHFCTGASRDW